MVATVDKPKLFFLRTLSTGITPPTGERREGKAAGRFIENENLTSSAQLHSIECFQSGR